MVMQNVVNKTPSFNFKSLTLCGGPKSTKTAVVQKQKFYSVTLLTPEKELENLI